MAEEKTTFHRDEPLQEVKNEDKKPAEKKVKTKAKKKYSKNWVGYLVFVLGLACVATAVVLSGVLNNFFVQPEEYYTYDVNNSETLMRYLNAQVDLLIKIVQMHI